MGFWRDAGIYLGFVNEDVKSGGMQVREQAAPTAPPRPTRATITPDTALSIGAVYRSVSLIVSSVSQLDPAVYRQNEEIPLPALVKQPNVNDTASGFYEETAFSLATHGNAYWRLYRSGPNEAVQSIEVIDPNVVRIEMETDHNGLDTGKRTYWVGGVKMPRHQIKHLKLMRQPGKVYGLGPIQAASGELEAALRLREFADTWFDTSGVPIGYLTTDMTLGPEESAAFAQAWKKFLRENEGTGVLSQGLDYKHLGVKPAEAQFIEVQKFVIVSIARLFGVPAMHLLAEMPTSNTYLNLEQANMVFLQTTLARYINEIENALSDLLPRGQKVNFKEEGLLRMDSPSKWKVRKIQIETGARTINEVRAEDNLPPIPGGDEKPAPAPAPAPAPQEDED